MNSKRLQKADSKKPQKADGKKPQEAESKKPQKADSKKPQEAESKKPQKADGKKPQETDSKKLQKADSRKLKKTDSRRLQKVEDLRRAVTVLAVWMVFFLFSGGLLFSGRQVQAATVCTVRFRESDGSNSKALKELTIKVKKGKKITFPALPDKNGYISLGWSKKMNSTKAGFQPSDKVKISKNTIFYAVRLRGCIVKFTNNKGTNNGQAYKKMARLVKKDTALILPAVPEVAGYENLGWTTKQGQSAPLYPAGTQVRIYEDITFYAVRKKNDMVTIQFADNDGDIPEEYKALEITALSGRTVTLPAVPNPQGYTFLGWAGASGSTKAAYLAGQQLSVSGNLKLYAVMYPRTGEEDPSFLENGWQMLFKQLIFVGDSRINRMKETLVGQFGDGSAVLKNVSFICAEGKGLAWFMSTGFDALWEKVSQNQIIQVEKPTAIIFNLGVNDACLKSRTSTAEKYISYMNEIAPRLLEKNCRLFYMTVTPINSTMLVPTGLAPRTEANLLAFNQGIQNGLCSEDGAYAYLDIYSWMIENGYSHDTGKHNMNTGVDDGLHYTTRTYKRIFNECALMLVDKSRTG